jgi:hypothetical protein
MTRLIDLKAPKQRFARSINVERDSDGSAIEGYLPVGRAIDVIYRLASALDRSDTERALSVTGPYGSGKSSLAVVIDALIAPANDSARIKADTFLKEVSPEISNTMNSARSRLGASKSGFIRASATASREPVVSTVLRALSNGVTRFPPPARQKAEITRIRSALRKMCADFEGSQRIRPDTRGIRQMVAELTEIAPVLILIDEFGKNLEAFADDASNSDLFLLQELAEWTHGKDGLPLAVVTLQHMAFDEYASGTSATQRREWAKVQGRFEDIAFVDSPAQTRFLISAAFGDAKPPLRSAVDGWSQEQAENLTRLGTGHLSLSSSMLAACWPLHPIALAVLPDLCERYGQNERTLFSFLAGHEPLSVATFLRQTDWNRKGQLPVVHLDRLYDYFVESAATMVSVSSAASRWIEIDNRIRDAQGVSSASLRVLKTVGLLNLISASGALRASKTMVCFAAADGQVGTTTEQAVANELAELERIGIVTYREFADEYRVWQGSDFDLKSAIEVSHRRLRDEKSAIVLERVCPLGPVVASRHSHETGTLRVFDRHWVDQTMEIIEPLGDGARADGSLIYVLGPDAPASAVERRTGGRPVAFVTTADASDLVAAAREMAAIDDVLSTTVELKNDWVAKRELLERQIEARAIIDRELERAYGSANGRSIALTFRGNSPRSKWMVIECPSISAGLSAVADDWYDKAPPVHNDLANRLELTSQIAKARRLLIEAMLTAPEQEGLGILGFGPERTLHLSVLQEFGLHQLQGESWGFCEPPPTSGVRQTWDRLSQLLTSATSHRRRVSEIYDELAAPPYGIRPGIGSLLVIVALIVYSEEVALYEHGTFKPSLTGDICERLIRNPVNFEIKHFALRAGSRAELLTQIAVHLKIRAGPQVKNGRVNSALTIVSRLVGLMGMLPEYSKRTEFVSSDARLVRGELLQATEPDALLFSAIPLALGKEPIGPTGHYDVRAIRGIAMRTYRAMLELQQAYPKMLEEIRSTLQEQLRGPEEGLRESLVVRARDLRGKVIEPALARLVAALIADIPGDDEWAEYVAMSVTGVPPGSWSDDDRRRFFGQLHDVGSTFRRIEALNADVRSRGESFEALRVTVTRSDGAEAARLVWVDDSRRNLLEPIIQSAIETTRKHSGSDTEARDLLLAMLAEADLLSTEMQLTDRLETAMANNTAKTQGKGRGAR